MADAAAAENIDHIDHLGTSLVARVAFATLPLMLGLLPLIGPHTALTAWTIPVAIAMFVIVFILTGRPGIRLLPHALVLTSLGRREVIPWTDIDSIESVRTFNQIRAAIGTADGTWRCPGFASPNRRFQYPIVPTQIDLLRASWFAAGGGQGRPAPPRPWGPDPLALDTVRLEPVGFQSVIVNTTGFIPIGYASLVGPAIFLYASWQAIAFCVALVALVAGITARRRVVLTPAGLEYRHLTTTFVPWSAITAVTTVSGPWGYLRPGAKTTAQGPVRVRLHTSVGIVTLPCPMDDPCVPDPRFDRKLEFIQRCWEAHRGAAWTAPPPPRVWRPPPPAA